MSSPEPLEIQELRCAIPSPAAHCMEMAAVCGSDVHAAAMPSTLRPVIFGHENVGVLAKLTKGIEKDVLGRKLSEGDRVVFRASPCGKCYGCALGENCDDKYQYGYIPLGDPLVLTGGFSQYLHLHPGRAWLLRVPDDMTTSGRSASSGTIPSTARFSAPAVSAGGYGCRAGAGPIGMGGLIKPRSPAPDG